MNLGTVGCLTLTLVTFGLAGCISSEDVTDLAATTLEEGTQALPVRVEARDCVESGGVSTYNMDWPAQEQFEMLARLFGMDQTFGTGPTKDFEFADNSDEIGSPLINSYMVPRTGPTYGIWHVAVVCKSYNFDGSEKASFKYGWVAMKVKPPKWDTSGIQRQFLVADLSFTDPAIVQGFVKTTEGLHVSNMLAGQVDWLAPGVVYVKLDDENHGVFETWSKMKAYREPEMGVTRYWMLKAAMAGHGHEAADASSCTAEAEECPTKYVPIPIDLYDSGKAKHLVSDGQAFLTHTRTDAHGPVPGTGGNLAAVYYGGFSRTMVLGEAPAGVLLEETWTH